MTGMENNRQPEKKSTGQVSLRSLDMAIMIDSTRGKRVAELLRRSFVITGIHGRTLL
jgi:hypothetical protein